MISYLNLTTENNLLRDQYRVAIDRVLSKSAFILGDEVYHLEQEISAYLSARYSVAVNSGTDALVLALAAIGIQPGDEVITTPFTFVATVEAIIRAGAIPRFADIDMKTFNLDVQNILPLISKKTKAVLAVNLYGHPCDVEAIRKICDQQGIQFILDSAQAFGATFNGKHLNSYADITTFSFFPSKVLGGLGDGGMLVTDQPEFYQKARRLRNHGSVDKQTYLEIGYNSRLDEIQAACLRVKLQHLSQLTAARRRCAEQYSHLLNRLKLLVLPAEQPGCQHAWNLYTVRISAGRDTLQQYLNAQGITNTHLLSGTHS